MTHGGSLFVRGMKLTLCGLCMTAWGSLPAGAAETSALDTGAAGAASTSISAGPMSFGDISGVGVFSGTATIAIRAPRGAAYRVALNGGLSSSGGSRFVTKQDGTAGIPYQLCKDAGCTMPWGDSDLDDTFPRGTSLPGRGTGRDQHVTVFGRLVVSTLPPPGSYHDSVLVTVFY